jgi:hypothetical protein
VSLAALVAPAAALAFRQAPGDGTLVVQNGSAPKGTAVVTLTIRGSVIGQISGLGKIVIEYPGEPQPEVSGYSSYRQSPDSDKGTWGSVPSTSGGQPLRFRAIDGYYRITIYGSGVDLIASGQGSVVLAGSPDAGIYDGKYSLNGQDFRSLPATPTKQLGISTPTSTTTG